MGARFKAFREYASKLANWSRQRSYPTNSCERAKVEVGKANKSRQPVRLDSSKQLGDDLALSKVSQLTFAKLELMKALKSHDS
jgi:hypothetical protein